MPAPAVIPAPRAYINAVAVKGFVVELRTVKDQGASHPPGRRPLLLLSVNVRNKHRGNDPPELACNVRKGAPVCLTVTKKARPKQSFDMNLKAWDNEAYQRITVSAFVGFKDPREIMASALTSGSGSCPHASAFGRLAGP